MLGGYRVVVGGSSVKVAPASPIGPLWTFAFNAELNGERH
jgi:hypothetical protein